MQNDDLIEHVQGRLDDIWPGEMRRRTASDLQWGQLVATAAVEAVAEALEQEARRRSKRDWLGKSSKVSLWVRAAQWMRGGLAVEKQLGVCPSCDHDDEIENPSGDFMVCGYCGARWQGARLGTPA